MEIPAARKVNTPQAVAWRVLRWCACRKISVASPASMGTKISKVPSEVAMMLIMIAIGGTVAAVDLVKSV